MMTSRTEYRLLHRQDNADQRLCPVGHAVGLVSEERYRRVLEKYAAVEKERKRLEHTFFLVPGYGAQGGTAEDVQYAFDKYGHGAIVNSSRGIMCAWQKTGGDGRDFAQAARDAAIAMRDDIRRFVTIV